MREMELKNEIAGVASMVVSKDKLPQRPLGRIPRSASNAERCSCGKTTENLCGLCLKFVLIIVRKNKFR